MSAILLRSPRLPLMPDGTWQLGIGLILFGSALPMSRFVTAEVPVLQGTAMRLGAAGAFFLPFLWTQRRHYSRLTWQDAGLICAVAFSLVSVSGLMMCSSRWAPCSAICMVTSLTPVMTAAGAMIFLKEHPTRHQWGWLVVAGLSSIVMRAVCESTENLHARWSLLALGIAASAIAVCCEAGGILLCKVAMRRLPPLVLAATSTVIAALLLIPFALFSEQSLPVHELPLATWIAAIWWGAGSLALGTWFWYRGLGVSLGTTAAMFLSLLPYASLMMSWLLLPS